MTIPNPYDLTTHGGKKVDWITHVALLEVEERLPYELSVAQGSYNKGGVSASAGTHDGGGVVDLLAWDWERKVRALREVGFAAWHRPTVPNLWGAHIHAVLIGNERLSMAAKNQVTAYKAGRDGLKSNAADTFWRPDPIPTFTLAKYRAHFPAPEPVPTPRWDGSVTALRDAVRLWREIIAAKPGSVDALDAQICIDSVSKARKLSKTHSTKF